MLYHVEFAINSTGAESIERSPFELVYGEQVRLPVDIIVGTQNRMSDAAHFAQHIQQLVQDAKNHLKKAQDYQKRYFNKHYRLKEHFIGEAVLPSSKTLHLACIRKLRARFVGPFRAMECIGKTAYRLDLKGRFKSIHNVSCVSQLKKHISGGSSTTPPEPIQMEGEEYFEVEALLKRRSRVNSW